MKNRRLNDVFILAALLVFAWYMEGCGFRHIFSLAVILTILGGISWLLMKLLRIDERRYVEVFLGVLATAAFVIPFLPTLAGLDRDYAYLLATSVIRCAGLSTISATRKGSLYYGEGTLQLLVILFFILTYISPALIHTQANTGMMYLAAALFTAVTFSMIPILRMYARNNTL